VGYVFELRMGQETVLSFGFWVEETGDGRPDRTEGFSNEFTEYQVWIE